MISPLARLSLRTRVALAFLLTTTVALIAVGAFVHLRVASTLEERLEDTLQAELRQVLETPADRRSERVRALTGETYAQLLDERGAVAASSTRVVGRLLETGAPATDGYVDREVRVRDDEADARDAAVETESALLLVHRDQGQVIVIGTSRDDTDQAVAEVRAQLLVVGPIVLLLAGLLGYVVAGLGLRPIEQVRARAAEISERNIQERLPIPPAHDELRRLALTLNAMLDRLDEGLRRQHRFVAVASHELRTPLALIRTEIELALARERTNEELVDALRSTEEEAGRMGAMAEDLLLLASADEDALDLDRAPFDLADLARDVIRRFEPAARAGARTLTVTAAEVVTVVGDRDRLDQVIANLVDNGLRHGRGAVDVAVEQATDGGVVLSVTDAGPGFTDERPFDRFVGARGSTGLGLSIVLEIIRAHGGTVTVESPGHRSGVRVLLPVQSPPESERRR